MSRPLKFKGGTQQVMVRLPKEQYRALMARTDKEGIPLAEQFRRAVTLYLDTHGKKAKKNAASVAAVSLSPKHAIEAED